MREEALDHLLVLQEFRLKAADSAGVIERIVSTTRAGSASAVPLLISVDDARDVATLRIPVDQRSKEADREQRAALAPFVASWRPLRWYRSRVAANAQPPPRYYRMAVTESGINDVEKDLLSRHPPHRGELNEARRIALLWIGAPVETHAGLLVLVGHCGDAPFARRDISGWPLPLSRVLGVRIYQGSSTRPRTKLH